VATAEAIIAAVKAGTVEVMEVEAEVVVGTEAEAVAVEQLAEPLQPAAVERATQEAAEEAVSSALQALLPPVHLLV